MTLLRSAVLLKHCRLPNGTGVRIATVCTQINEPYAVSVRLVGSLKNLFVCTRGPDSFLWE